VAGLKRRFLAFGLLNITITTGLLKLLLAINLATGLATLLSQLLNLGLVAYSTAPRCSGWSCSASARLSPMAAWPWLLWLGNWAGISGLAQAGWPRCLAALALIPVLAAGSYLAQKHLVFLQRRQS
jgi:hypothetical protein